MVGIRLERGGIRLWLELPSAGRSTAVWWAFLQQWVLRAAAEPSDLEGDTAQKCDHSCLAVGIPNREKKPQNLVTP